MKPLLSITEASERLGLSVDTVRKLENVGELKSVRTPGGHRRFALAVLDAWLARRGAGTHTRRPRVRARAADRDRNRIPREEPPEDKWDEPAPVRPVPPPSPPRKSPQEQLLDELRQAMAERAEHTRIANLRSYGQSLVRYDATASARSAVIEELNSYVNPKRFPPSTDTWDARRAIQAKVEAILEPYKEAAARKAAETAKQEAEDAAEEAAEKEAEQRIQSLIEHGKSRAFWATTRWERDDREEARRDVEEALEDQVEADWSERDVDDFVDQILDESEEEDA